MRPLSRPVLNCVNVGNKSLKITNFSGKINFVKVHQAAKSI